MGDKLRQILWKWIVRRRNGYYWPKKGPLVAFVNPVMNYRVSQEWEFSCSAELTLKFSR
jgi:hypothetical protein